MSELLFDIYISAFKHAIKYSQRDLLDYLPKAKELISKNTSHTSLNIPYNKFSVQSIL